MLQNIVTIAEDFKREYFYNEILLLNITENQKIFEFSIFKYKFENKFVNLQILTDKTVISL